MDAVRLTVADSEIRDLARQVLATGEPPRTAAKKLGISREALLALAAGASVRAATFALVRERLSTSEKTNAPAGQG